MAKSNAWALSTSFAERKDIIEFNNFVRELGKFPLDKKDPNILDIVKSHCDEYRKLCADYNMTPSWEGIALALGKTRQTLTQWRDGNIQWVKDKGITEYLQTEWAWINSVLITSMQDGRVDKISGIFIARNNFGYVNEDQPTKKQEINVNLSMEQLIEGAKNLKATVTQPEKMLVQKGTGKFKTDAPMREKVPSRAPKKNKSEQRDLRKPSFVDDIPED